MGKESLFLGLFFIIIGIVSYLKTQHLSSFLILGIIGIIFIILRNEEEKLEQRKDKK